MLSFCTCVPQITIIWCMVPEIWSATDIIFCHFGSFFALWPYEQPKSIKILKKGKTCLEILSFYTCDHKWQSHVQFLRYGAWLTLFFVILPIFFPFTQLITQKIKTLKERKKCLLILLFYTCVPKIIWCMVPEIWSATDTFFIIVDHFLPGYSSTNPENQNFEKMKRRNAQKYHHFTQVYHNDNHMMYGSWDMKQDRQNLSSFWATFCPLTPLKTTKFLKKWKKKAWRYHHSTQVHQKSWSYALLFLRYSKWRM